MSEQPCAKYSICQLTPSAAAQMLSLRSKVLVMGLPQIWPRRVMAKCCYEICMVLNGACQYVCYYTVQHDFVKVACIMVTVPDKESLQDVQSNSTSGRWGEGVSHCKSADVSPK